MEEEEPDDQSTRKHLELPKVKELEVAKHGEEVVVAEKQLQQPDDCGRLAGLRP